MADATGIGSETIVNLNDYSERNLVKLLKTIVSKFGMYESTWRIFIQEFPGFVVKRVVNIKYMDQLAEELNNNHSKCDIVTLIGASIGVAGGIVGIAGALLLAMATGRATTSPLHVLAPAIAATGGTTATIGGLISIGASVTVHVIEKAKAKNVITLLKLDAESFQKTFPCVQHTADLKQAVEGIMNFHVFQDLMKSFNNDPDIVNLIKEGAPIYELPLGVTNYIEDFFNDDQKRELTELLLAIFRSPRACRLFGKILDFFKIMAPFIGTLVRFLNSTIGYMRSVDISFNARNAVTRLGIAGNSTTRMTTLFGVLSAASAAIDIWILVLTSKNMSNDSKSDFVQKIRKCIERMQCELDELEQAYVALMNGL